MELSRISDPLPEELKLAVLTRCISGQLKTYVNVRLDDAKYDAMRCETLFSGSIDPTQSLLQLQSLDMSQRTRLWQWKLIASKAKANVKEKTFMEKENKMVKAKAMVHLV